MSSVHVKCMHVNDSISFLIAALVRLRKIMHRGKLVLLSLIRQIDLLQMREL